MSNIEQFVNALNNDNMVDAKEAFETAIAAKISDKFEARKVELAANIAQNSGITEAKMDDSEVLKAATALAKNGKDEKAKDFGQGLVDYYKENDSFTPNQVSGLQNIMKNASFQMAKEEVELNENKATKDQASFLVSNSYLSKLGLTLTSQKNVKGSGTMNVVLKAPDKRTGKKAFAEIKKDLGRFSNVRVELKGLDDVIEVTLN